MIPSARTGNSSSTGLAVVADRSVSVKLEPRIEAARRACNVSSGRKLSRRRIVSRSVGGSVTRATSACPPAVSIISSWASAPSISVMNSGLPAAPEIPASSLRPGAAATVSATRAVTACSRRPSRVRCRPPAAVSEAMSWSSSGLPGDGRKHAMMATGR